MTPTEFRRWYAMLPEPMLLVLTDGTVLTANPAADVLFGRECTSDVIALSSSPDGSRESFRHFLTQCGRSRDLTPGSVTLTIAGGETTQFRVEGALLAPAAAGEPARLLLRFLTKQTATERFLILNERIDALNKEVAERQRAEHALAQTNEELKRANADLEQFAYSASHDLREPLRMISIYSELLNRRLQFQSDAQTVEYLGFTVQSARRMEALLHDLLAYTQVVSLKQHPGEPVDADRSLDTALENLRHTIQENGALVHREPLPVVVAQEVHLLQIFQNLLSNALKYRSVAAPVLSITATSEGSLCTIRVQDNGIGIDPQYADQIFGIFKRLHTADRYPGTGIGLAICQKIIQRYGGRIWVESSGEARGATFCFTLPRHTSSIR